MTNAQGPPLTTPFYKDWLPSFPWIRWFSYVQQQLSVPTLLGLKVYANNAAAKGAGLGPGDLYRTGADPDVVCVVH